MGKTRCTATGIVALDAETFSVPPLVVDRLDPPLLRRAVEAGIRCGRRAAAEIICSVRI